jgi:prepilin-type N-terminal cleavage/methylation domain-containing protein
MRLRPTAGRRTGFTLMELVVVLVILGVVLGIAGPAFIVRGAAMDEGAPASVVRTLERARRTAIESARVTTVTIDPRSARAWVRTEGRERSDVDTSFTLALPRDAVLSAAVPRARFTFDARGGASGDSLIVSAPAGRAIVTVDRASGDVRVIPFAVGEAGHAVP